MAVGSFSAGLTGLNAFSSWLGVIGNNLANINTVGYKTATVSFQDLVSQSINTKSGNPTQIGLGVALGSVSQVFSQGGIEGTRDPLNVALQGNGFFVVKGDGSNAYTRAGNFSFDDTGTLVNAEGRAVQGWMATNGAITNTTTPGSIVVSPGMMRTPVATSTFKTVTNLNSSAAINDTFTSSVQIYDAVGTQHTLTTTYTKTAQGAWSYKVEAPGAEVTGGTAGTSSLLSAGTLTFGTNGTLASLTPTAPATGGGTGAAIKDVTFTTPTWKSGAAASALTFDLVDTNGTASVTGFDSVSETSSTTQNGSASGMLSNISVDSDGTIKAQFGASGKIVALGQLATANFGNVKGLVKNGNNLYGATEGSGEPNIGAAGSAGRGTIIGSALEQSNVDIAQEFTSMILAQRGYTANSKTITTSDEMLVETLNLKR